DALPILFSPHQRPDKPGRQAAITSVSEDSLPYSIPNCLATGAGEDSPRQRAREACRVEQARFFRLPCPERKVSGGRGQNLSGKCTRSARRIFASDRCIVPYARRELCVPLIPLYQCLKEAEKGGYGVGAFNVNNMEQIQGIMKAARELNSPVILQASRGALKYTDMVYLKYLVQAAVEQNPDIPVVLHLDHGDSLETVKKAIELGFTSVMIDASHHDFETNVRISREVVEYAHQFGDSVEAELGTLGGIEEDVAGEVQLTDPDQAEEFVERVGCDALAVAIGTSHGAYKFKG